MNDNETHDYGIISMAEYLSCEPKIIFDLFNELKIDSFSDLETMARLKPDAVKYETALANVKKANSALEKLSRFEHAVFDIAQSRLLQNLTDAELELEGLVKRISATISKSKSIGSRNKKADAIAELLAQIFIKLDRPITFGVSSMSTKNLPSTDFGRAVQKGLEIFHVYGFPVDENGKNELGPRANWRAPAERAFQKFGNSK